MLRELMLWGPALLIGTLLSRAWLAVARPVWANVRITEGARSVLLRGHVVMVHALGTRVLLIDELDARAGHVQRTIHLGDQVCTIEEAPEATLRLDVVTAGASHDRSLTRPCDGWKESRVVPTLCERCAEPREEHELEAQIARALGCRIGELGLAWDLPHGNRKLVDVKIGAERIDGEAWDRLLRWRFPIHPWADARKTWPDWTPPRAKGEVS